MTKNDIQQDLINYTIANSSFDSSRDYIGLSKISGTVDEMISDLNNGFKESTPIKLKCYKGYQMEADLKKRLKVIYGDDFIEKVEICAFEGRVKGHPDGRLFGKVTDIKSVLKDEWIPAEKLPNRVYWQVQGYLLYDKTDFAYVIYESRETGLIKVFEVFENKRIQIEIDNKIREALGRIYGEP